MWVVLPVGGSGLAGSVTSGELPSGGSGADADDEGAVSGVSEEALSVQCPTQEGVGYVFSKLLLHEQNVSIISNTQAAATWRFNQIISVQQNRWYPLLLRMHHWTTLTV